MDIVFQVSLLAVSVGVGAAAVLRLTTVLERDTPPARIDVPPVSSAWLADHRTRSRPE